MTTRRSPLSERGHPVARWCDLVTDRTPSRGWPGWVTATPRRWPARPEPVTAAARRSGEVEAVEVHDLVPRRHEVPHELLLRVVGGVDLGEGTELRVRAE